MSKLVLARLSDVVYVSSGLESLLGDSPQDYVQVCVRMRVLGQPSYEVHLR